MSIGNLKDQGNKGNNFPYQLAALKLAGMSQMRNLEEICNDGYSNIKDVCDFINDYFDLNPDKYLVSKVVTWNGTKYAVLLTVASI